MFGEGRRALLLRPVVELVGDDAVEVRSQEVTVTSRPVGPLGPWKIHQRRRSMMHFSRPGRGGERKHRSQLIKYGMALAAAGLVGLGCGSSSGSGGTGGTGGTGGGSSTGLAQTCSSMLDSLTPLYEDCFKATPAVIDQLEASNSMASACQDAAKAVAAGRAAYDSAQAATCLAAYQGATCATFEQLTELEACRMTLTGTVDAGGACYTDTDCAGGTCDTTTVCPGTCVAWLAPSQPFP